MNKKFNKYNVAFADDLHSVIGISLVLGFIFMLLVDQCSARRSGGKEKSVTATLGLVVHAAADGVALGAAATTSQADVEVIVFLAIMLHKVKKKRTKKIIFNLSSGLVFISIFFTGSSSIRFGVLSTS